MSLLMPFTQSHWTDLFGPDCHLANKSIVGLALIHSGHTGIHYKPYSCQQSTALRTRNIKLCKCFQSDSFSSFIRILSDSRQMVLIPVVVDTLLAMH